MDPDLNDETRVRDLLKQGALDVRAPPCELTVTLLMLRSVRRPVGCSARFFAKFSIDDPFKVPGEEDLATHRTVYAAGRFVRLKSGEQRPQNELEKMRAKKVEPPKAKRMAETQSHTPSATPSAPSPFDGRPTPAPTKQQQEAAARSAAPRSTPEPAPTPEAPRYTKSGRMITRPSRPSNKVVVGGAPPGAPHGAPPPPPSPPTPKPTPQAAAPKPTAQAAAPKPTAQAAAPKPTAPVPPANAASEPVVPLAGGKPGGGQALQSNAAVPRRRPPPEPEPEAPPERTAAPVDRTPPKGGGGGMDDLFGGSGEGRVRVGRPTRRTAPIITDAPAPSQPQAVAPVPEAPAPPPAAPSPPAAPPPTAAAPPPPVPTAPPPPIATAPAPAAAPEAGTRAIGRPMVANAVVPKRRPQPEPEPERPQRAEKPVNRTPPKAGGGGGMDDLFGGTGEGRVRLGRTRRAKPGETDEPG